MHDNYHGRIQSKCIIQEGYAKCNVSNCNVHVGMNNNNELTEFSKIKIQISVTLKYPQRSKSVEDQKV